MDSIIAIQGSLGPHPRELLGTVMSNTSNRLGRPLRRQEENEELVEDGYCFLTKPGSDEVTGRIRIRLATTEQVHTLDSTLQAAPFLLGEEYITVQVSNPKMDALPMFRPGNGMGVVSLTTVATPSS